MYLRYFVIEKGLRPLKVISLGVFYVIQPSHYQPVSCRISRDAMISKLHDGFASWPLERACELLMFTDNKVKPALDMALKNVNIETAEIELKNAHGNINLIL